MKFWESNHQSVQEGDMQFIALYKFYYQDLYAYGVSLGFNTEDVKDAIQEIYLKLYFNERLCIDEKKIKFYLLRSVRNQLIDWERTKKDTSSIEEEERSFKLSVSVEESFISDEEDLLLKKRVNRILDLLTDHQREIVYLHFIEEMPYEEIAVMLDMKIQTVRGQVFKAMEKLRKLDSKDYFLFFLILYLHGVSTFK
ncbi:RNA polymerase ECF-type sigma factor [Bacteroides ovatus]|jgi:RNA polymerase sigma factor, sigma-70 family|uniref:RNA polymerase sigma factor n=1 Tax=Bacteroides zhangwenhongii TaxID=2650157 RepID=A0ABT5HBM4_9BACE|nr:MULTISPECIES: RNA polymerase sigma factor [Bacteroides]MCS3176539.1 RNA polymerase sigma factor [Candidatus Bacteroides intestinigallinarum]MDC7137361.1 RNA polymerase sigma factor [Bacteroides zhangwenhongii]RGN55992.1 RNA polymerase sigma factor [Bacteroides sp. OM05-10AA]RGQ61084.1 RNA polymerase sigma factor [Bacteroides sp. AF27-33]CAG9901634.1 RNA polymerase ECF-type sigma factor [Bacteroides ovatus]